MFLTIKLFLFSKRSSSGSQIIFLIFRKVSKFYIFMFEFCLLPYITYYRNKLSNIKDFIL